MSGSNFRYTKKMHREFLARIGEDGDHLQKNFPEVFEEDYQKRLKELKEGYAALRRSYECASK